MSSYTLAQKHLQLSCIIARENEHKQEASAELMNSEDKAIKKN